SQETSLMIFQAHFLHHPKSDSPRLPQIIAHRGYKEKYPENTICAIDGAIQAGTNAVEIDLHLTRDGVIVLSHDATLQRCFGVKKKIIDCDWDYLKTLRTLQVPHEPMPRLVDVLQFMRQPGREDIWILLDLKLSNDPETIMSVLAKTIESVPIPAVGPDWHRRVVLGCWSARYLPGRERHLPRYPITLICFDLGYARQFLHVPGISFNINQKILMSPLGRGFLEEAKMARRQVYLWTVNEPNLMRWGIRQKVDGIISDSPALLKEVHEDWQSGTSPHLTDPKLDRVTWRQHIQIYVVMMYVVFFSWIFKRKYLPSVERVQVEERKLS
ncbi:hypothetical protein N7495_004923, partial [Penicillium taxi]|uniref:uncharacterized protein n=1 Tax=Penicillium taxi TaxID=168475 RepID=UPI002545713B